MFEIKVLHSTFLLPDLAESWSIINITSLSLFSFRQIQNITDLNNYQVPCHTPDNVLIFYFSGITRQITEQ